MNRTHKHCLIASSGMHLFLLLLLVFGSAFLAPEPKLIPAARLTMVPSRLVDAALSGGGGNPNVKPSDERLKGETLVPQPEEPKPVQPKPVEPPKRVEPPAPKPEPAAKPPEPKVAEKSAPSKKASPKEKEGTESLLKPVSKAEARKLAQAAGAAAAERQARQQAAQLGGAIERLRAGYADGTAVEVHGTGGAAYANYAQFIFEIFDQAWIIDKDMNGEDATTKVQVIIERSGRVKEARIIRPSGNPALDATVQKALNRVKTVPPFPAEAKDRERTFIINFNLQAKLSSA